ncbi:hypothetical protein [Actinomadura parmotrematis]|uniref:Lipoprotein n=1 Tax=Actinomadura parmotrematis TaxID=2864039 RepID=A0ABS7FPW1_9ACTN|nr:hypothetical protein [Actinomadura parmotrematis]MBW8482351.1 hypothetical protein [Actinomadura parmotrematis]
MADPWNLRERATLLAVMLAVASVVTAAALYARLGRGALAAAAGILVGSLGCSAAVVVGYVDSLALKGTVAARVVSADGRHTLVTLSGTGFFDPYYEVVLRAGHGLLAQQSGVWESVAKAGAPKSARFLGPDRVEVVADNGCRYISSFDRGSLEAVPRWRMTDRGGCAAERY